MNGKPIGFTEEPAELAAVIRGLRRTRHIHEFVSVHCKPILRCVHVVSDGGRLCRPYIIVSNGRPLLTQSMLNVSRKSTPSPIPVESIERDLSTGP